MNTSQLQCCVKCDSILNERVVVCAADRFPERLTYFPCAVIANTDEHDRPGRHWCAFYFDQRGRGEFFDSYGHPPNYYSKLFLQFLKSNAKADGIVNTKRLQSDFSKVCGFYCLWFLHQRFQRIPMQDIVNSFSEDFFTGNDDFVYKMFLRAFPYCPKDECAYNQTCKSLF